MSQPIVKNQLTLLGDDYLEIWIQAFLSDRKAQNLTKGSLRFYRFNLDGFAAYCESQAVKKVSQITPNLLREFLLYLGDNGHKAGGIHGFYRSVRAFLKWYWDETEPDYKNPIEKVKAPKVAIEPIQGITKEEFETLVSVCDKSFLGERDKAILMVLMDTGIRAAELCGIKLEDINLFENSILVSQGKGRKPRTVFIGKRTRKQIRKYLKLRGTDGIYLFTNRSEDPLVYIALREIIRRLCLQAGIKGISLHDFRRGFCLASLQAGVDLLTLSRIMGHSGLSLLSRYAKQSNSDIASIYKSVID